MALFATTATHPSSAPHRLVARSGCHLMPPSAYLTFKVWQPRAYYGPHFLSLHCTIGLVSFFLFLHVFLLLCRADWRPTCGSKPHNEDTASGRILEPSFALSGFPPHAPAALLRRAVAHEGDMLRMRRLLHKVR